MTITEQAPVSLEDARQLVALLEQGDNQGAAQLLESITMADSMELFAEVGKLTRQLHDSLNNFQLDARIADLAQEDIPDAQSRLNYVIETTEDAANRTMDAVETSMPIAERLNAQINGILPEWKKLMTRQLQLGEFKALCHNMDKFLDQASGDSAKLNELLTEVLMAQGYQDLTGQVIRKVIDLVKEVEDSLVHMLTVFGEPEIDEDAKQAKKEASKEMAEGPIIDAASRDDVVTGQDDVDDLLSSLGF
ncbi:protein phosphatase CheZ [Bowmanella yangjiangensis]|uniref:Protein phosphatase CheZ n=1 Tax=Bowmanella yangjiangensis TaxID=2811230 RepID=A0ABS3CVW9_9ALTE|nr:protein phosphatase CheZ [Bowmanella yangjiangensis]MBN7821238.1 protein phosphatase CheZ [Bowmanella yangjiangensis]